MVKYPGVEITSGGVTYTFAPLSLGAVQQLGTKINQLGDGNLLADGNKVGTVIDVAFASAKRNHPEVTKEEIAEFIDIGNMQDVLYAVLRVSGYEQRAETEASEEGKQLTGQDSTPA